MMRTTSPCSDQRCRQRSSSRRAAATCSYSCSLIVVVLLLLGCPLSSAFVPPKPGSDLEATYEPVAQYRARLGIDFSYQPRLLHPELCRYLSEEECQHADEALQQHGKAHQETQELLYQQRRKLQQEQASHSSSLRGGAIPNPSSQKEDHKDFQEVLGAFTRAYGLGHTSSPEEERAELDQLLADFNYTSVDQAHRALNNPDDIIHNPSAGTFRVLVLLMKFTDHKSRSVPHRYEYQVLLNLRIRKWLDESSYGKYNVSTAKI
jgi:hypothetical protein